MQCSRLHVFRGYSPATGGKQMIAGLPRNTGPDEEDYCLPQRKLKALKGASWRREKEDCEARGWEKIIRFETTAYCLGMCLIYGLCCILWGKFAQGNERLYCVN